MGRLTDNDRRIGRRITYGKTNGWNPFRAVFSSGDSEDASTKEVPRNELTLYAFGWCMRIRLGSWLQHHKIRHKATYWDEATIKRMGRDWYEECFPKEYGFSYDKGFLIIYHGAHTHDSRSTKSWSHTMGWSLQRHIRTTLYDDKGVLFWEQRNKNDIRGVQAFTDQYEAEKACPKQSFMLKDKDGTDVVAVTHIQEREWAKGDGYFKWLSWFMPNMVRRRLDIEFDRETGNEKGSWKGGVVGTSIDMGVNETHEQAMRRYCDTEHRDKGGRYKMLFIGPEHQPYPDPKEFTPNPAT